MPKFLRKLVVVCAWACMACLAQAQTDADTATALVRSSGMWSQSELIAPQVRSGFLLGLTSSKGRISKTEVERVVRTIDRVYAPGRFQAGLVASLQSGIQAEHVVHLRNWFASDLASAIVRLEASSEAASNPQEMVQQGVAILKAQSAERRALLDELVSASRAVDTMTQMTIDTSMAFMDAMRDASTEFGRLIPSTSDPSNT